MNVIPEHKTNNLVLRFIGTNIFHPISHIFLNKALRVSFIYEDCYEDLSFTPPKFDEYRIKAYHWLYYILDKPYSRWGTFYRIEFDDADRELMERLGSDYDEDGIPYWDKT
jgi:hypothetical protein